MKRGRVLDNEQTNSLGLRMVQCALVCVDLVLQVKSHNLHVGTFSGEFFKALDLTCSLGQVDKGLAESTTTVTD